MLTPAPMATKTTTLPFLIAWLSNLPFKIRSYKVGNVATELFPSHEIVIGITSLETRKYDVDMLKELYAYKDRGPIVVLTGIEDQDLVNYCDGVVTLHSDLEDIQLAFAYIIFAQLLAYEKSLQIGLSPDNPSPTGAINRVVQGVTIYPYVGGK